MQLLYTLLLGYTVEEILVPHRIFVLVAVAGDPLLLKLWLAIYVCIWEAPTLGEEDPHSKE